MCKVIDMSSFLKYTKTVIEKVSFDRHLLNKEYKKCLGYLTNKERREFKTWLKRQPYYSTVESTNH